MRQTLVWRVLYQRHFWSPVSIFLCALFSGSHGRGAIILPTVFEIMRTHSGKNWLTALFFACWLRPMSPFAASAPCLHPLHTITIDSVGVFWSGDSWVVIRCEVGILGIQGDYAVVILWLWLGCGDNAKQPSRPMAVWPWREKSVL